MHTDDYFCEQVKVGGLTFIHFATNDGGRLIPASHIKSIIPDFKGSGSMIFLSGNDKAIKVPQTPEQIAHDLLEEPEAT